ncbi:hypothetical protein RHMOL_Rhmol12G0185800 [Rhododendron molle]|uniref:Uncharacterized protein n=1 Tax=Rhododendron molle TaxID=49168 RepID=A0ACC0LL81_RHOML|nr:hypothetical protein RHMOL_Rhmol12G0185800 [Rhododendron molle]
MDFGSHFPALRPTLLIRNPSLSGLNRSVNVLNKVVPLVRGKGIDHLDQITVENNALLVIEESDDPSASQIQALKAEIHSLRMELDSQSGKVRGPAVTDRNAQPLWTEVVTQPRVSSRMHFSYHPPLIKEARVVVCPPPEVIDAGVARWSKSVVGYFLDKKLPFIAVQNIAFRIWKKFGITKVMANAQGFYFFEFSQEDVYQKLVEAGPWHFGEKLLVLKQWSPQMKFEKEQFTKVPVWVQFHQVPLEMWNEVGLSYLASAVGVPLFADSPTETCQRLSYARLCIEVDVGVDLPDTVDVEYANGCQVTVGVKYQWKPVKCLNCHVFGHSETQCSAVVKIPKQEWVVKAAVVSEDSKVRFPSDAGSPSVNVQEIGVQEWVVKAAREQTGVVPDDSEVPFSSDKVSPVPVAPHTASSSQGLVARSSNSFSALALDDEVELGNDVLVLDDEVDTTVTVVPSPIVDIVVPPAKNTRGRGKGVGVAIGFASTTAFPAVANTDTEKVCGIQYSTLDQASSCPVPSPPEWPPLLQIPAPEYRAVRTDFLSFMDLPDQSCRNSGSCPASILLTGNNQTLGERLAGNWFTSSSTFNSSDILDSLAYYALGSDTETADTNFLEPAFFSNQPLYRLQPQCSVNSAIPVSIQFNSSAVTQEAICIQGQNLWRNSSSEVNDELYKGYRKGNSEGKTNEIVAAYDFLNSDFNNFNLSIWYNSTYNNNTGNAPLALMRVSRSVNLVSNAYLQYVFEPATKMLFEFVKEMPKPASKLTLDFSSILGPVFFTWVILQLFPVILTSLVYDKQQKIRIMMKMHGLGDGPYWMITYAYFLALSLAYMLCFVIFGSVIGLKFFILNDYSIQFVFYFLCINLQISMAFLIASVFSDMKTAAVIGYVVVFATGLFGAFLFQYFIQDTSFPRGWVIVMELYPGFSLYRGLYEFSQYAFSGSTMGTHGMRWGDLSDSDNGMKDALIIMSEEWLVVLSVAYYIDLVVSSGGGVGRSPLFFLKNFRKKLLSSSSLRKSSFGLQGPKVLIEMDKPDVAQEREKVEQLLLEPKTYHSIICDNLKKMYPKRDGNPEKFAVRGMSLALPQGECFGMLGPNGAGKTSFINMAISGYLIVFFLQSHRKILVLFCKESHTVTYVHEQMIGLIKPSSGTAYVGGLDIRTQMDEIYTSMGVCPQHDLLWETLTGREHLLFYGRLKNLKGSALSQAVEESLKSVNLFDGGVADKKAGTYSGGMKRRLSVAISLIGDPKVVYMDEPSTGLDPASRKNLWDVVKQAKQNRAIILTSNQLSYPINIQFILQVLFDPITLVTVLHLPFSFVIPLIKLSELLSAHSMEEAEQLCDRLGIFVDGSLQCIGNPKELKARYGGSYVFTMTTSSNHEEEVERLVKNLSRNANKIYHLSGTQKFELPKQEVRIAEVFQAVEKAKRRFTVQAWGLADTTLEDVFIKNSIITNGNGLGNLACQVT